MKKTVSIVLLLSTLLISQDSYVENQIYYMQQDGDLFEEDIATIEDEIFSARYNRYSFSRSKRLLATEVYPTHQKAFYSNCDYKIRGKKLIPIHSTCGFKYRKNRNRSKRIEWEHIVPAWHFGHQLRCWQKGGRMNCRETNTKFREMEADMHNLVPAIGEINGDRSNFKFGMIQGESRVYGKVNIEIDFSSKKVEPNRYLYGDIARTYLYMRDRYGLRISKSQEKMFIAWNNLDPVTRWERKRNKIIKKLQGNDNIYVSNYKKVEQLGSPTKTLSTKFSEIRDEFVENYPDFLDNFYKLVVEIGLTFIILSIMYRRKNR